MRDRRGYSMKKAKKRKRIDALGKEILTAYLAWNDQLRMAGKAYPQYANYESAFLDLTHLPEYKELERLGKIETALVWKQRRLEIKYNMKRCGDCGRWLPFKTKICSRCYYTNYVTYYVGEQDSEKQARI
jgi:hypothetical protein